MNKLLIQWAINAVAFFAAITLLTDNGIEPQNMEWWGYLGLALIFGIVSAVLRPILTVLGCPFLILTLGLGVLLINTLLFYLAGLIGTEFGVGFVVEGFWPAFLGALIVSVVSTVLNVLLRGSMEDDKSRD